MADLLQAVLVTASFAGVTFPVSRAEVDDAYDVVEHVAYRRDGADLEPTGRRARRGTLEVPLLNDLGEGELFPGRYFDLLQAVDDNRVGDFAHPTRGRMQAAITVVHERVEPDVRNGIVLTLSWVEHLASAGLLLADVGTTQDAPATAQARAQAADAAMAAADPTGSFALTAPAVAAALALLDAATSASFAQTEASLRGMLDVIDADMELAALATVSGYFAVRALAELRASVLALRSRYLPTASRTRLYTTPATMAAHEVAQAVYGDGRFAPLITQANSVVDYLAIPAGTQLVILPADG